MVREGGPAMLSTLGQSIASLLSAIGTLALAVWTVLHSRRAAKAVRRAEHEAAEATRRADAAEAKLKR